MPLLWCKVMGKTSTQGTASDLLVNVVAGRELAENINSGLPKTLGFTLKAMKTLLVPTPLLTAIYEQQLAQEKIAASEAAPRKGNKYLVNCSSLTLGYNLDGRPFTCGSKKEYTERMTHLHTMTRLFSDERGVKYLDDLSFQHELFATTCTVLMATTAHTRIAKTHVDYGLQRFVSLKGLAVMADGFGSDSRFQAAMLFKYLSTDFSVLAIEEAELGAASSSRSSRAFASARAARRCRSGMI
jgi:hypothetical protein